MTVLVRYDPTDGQIRGVWQGSPASMLAAQIPADPGTDAYLLVETDLDAATVAREYAIVQGALAAKTVLTLTAEPASFRGNGVMSCRISVSPFIPCTLLVQGQEVTLTAADPVLLLTSNMKQRIRISLAPMAAYRAEDRFVEAT